MISYDQQFQHTFIAKLFALKKSKGLFINIVAFVHFYFSSMMKINLFISICASNYFVNYTSFKQVFRTKYAIWKETFENVSNISK